MTIVHSLLSVVNVIQSGFEGSQYNKVCCAVDP